MDNLETAANMVYGGITRSKLEIAHAKTFLYLYGKTLTAEIDEDWSSYGITIGLAKSTLNVWCMYKTNEEPRKLDGTPVPLPPEHYAALALNILSVYRMVRIQNQEYKTNTMVRINNQIKGSGSDSLAITEAHSTYGSWTSDPTLNKLVAGIDMFFMRFREHPLSYLRIATIGSRYRDCAALMSYAYLMQVLGTKALAYVADWVFVEVIADDIVQMMKEDEELDLPFSYFPYQVDMGMVQKSAFSTSANPHFFFFAHVIGTLHFSERSKNALLTIETGRDEILYNAIIVAFVHARNRQLTKAFTESGEEVIVEDVSNQDEEYQVQQLGGRDRQPIPDEILNSESATAWFVYLSSINGVLPPRIHAYFKSCMLKIKEFREGTIAEYLKQDPIHSDI